MTFWGLLHEISKPARKGSEMFRQVGDGGGGEGRWGRQHKDTGPVYRLVYAPEVIRLFM